MKIVELAQLPNCDICKHLNGVENVASYDGPTDFGSHAYTCETCQETHGTGSSITVKLKGA